MKMSQMHLSTNKCVYYLDKLLFSRKTMCTMGRMSNVHCVSLVVFQLSDTPPRHLFVGGRIEWASVLVVAVLVYSLSHDFAVKCLQNV